MAAYDDLRRFVEDGLIDVKAFQRHAMHIYGLPKGDAVKNPQNTIAAAVRSDNNNYQSTGSDKRMRAAHRPATDSNFDKSVKTTQRSGV